MLKAIYIVATMAVVAALSASPAAETHYQGTLRAGYVSTDLEGNHSVYQPTYNLYEGVALSLEGFRYRWDNGAVLSGDVYQASLDNRRLSLALTRSGQGGLAVHHSSYRRPYDFDGDHKTMRRSTSASAWYCPIKQLELFSSFGVTTKDGETIDLLGPVSSAVRAVDYNNKYYQFGFEASHRRSRLRAEYRLSDYDDDESALNDRTTHRWRVSAFTPLPRFEDVALSGGLQRYENRIEDRGDSLIANTVWGAAQYSHRQGYQVRYSFAFDRARRTSDLSATDNIIHTVTVGKTWRGRGGITAGYRHRLNDDVLVERSGDGYLVAGWLAVSEELTLRAGMNSDDDNVDKGQTLTGKREYSRYQVSARYRLTSDFADGSTGLRIEHRQRDNDDIGSSIDFTRAALDLSLTSKRYGDLAASYGYGRGEYDNASGVFKYSEHVLSGEVLTREYRRVQLGFGGDYYRARRDVDVESFTIKFTGRYRLRQDTQLEIIYSAHNFDNMADAEPYTEYYTANVVQASIVFEL